MQELKSTAADIVHEEVSEMAEAVAEVAVNIAPMSCIEKTQAYIRFVMGWFGLLDLILCCVNVGLAARDCSKHVSVYIGWVVILQSCVLSILIIYIVVCAIFRHHALFLDQPFLFLCSCFHRWIKHRNDGLSKAIYYYSRHLDLRNLSKKQGAATILVGAFFSSLRAAIIVNLVFKFKGGASVIIAAVIIILQYLKFIFSQCIICVAMRKLGMGTGKAVCIGWIFATIIIYVFPIVVSYLIWSNMDKGTRMCMP